MFKKGYSSFLALIFSLILILGMTACNSNETNSNLDNNNNNNNASENNEDQSNENNTSENNEDQEDPEQNQDLPETYELSLVEWMEYYDAGEAAVVVDVRSPGELEELGKFADSININNDDIKENPAIISDKLGELGIEKDEMVLIHCKSGGRAGAALEQFKEQGYTNTFALMDNTYFTEEGDFRYGLNPTEWDKLYTSGKAAVVIDARRPDELEQDGKLPNSTNINNDDIKADPNIITQKLEELGVEKTDLVLTHCKSGGRAAGVNDQLQYQGYTYSFYLAHGLVYPEDGGYEYPEWEIN